MVTRVRWMSMLSAVATLIGIAVVIGVVGYRIFKSDGRAGSQTEFVSMLPKGAKVISTATTADRVVVTIDVQGTTEIRAFDAGTLQPAGRLRFVNEP